MNQDGIWLPILEYAVTKKTSVSTIRRSIKAGHLKYKEENGKYLIWTRSSVMGNSQNLVEEIESLRFQKMKLQEELNDLKMLLNVYENQTIRPINNLPPIPELDL